MAKEAYDIAKEDYSSTNKRTLPSFSCALSTRQAHTPTHPHTHTPTHPHTHTPTHPHTHTQKHGDPCTTTNPSSFFFFSFSTFRTKEGMHNHGPVRLFVYIECVLLLQNVFRIQNDGQACTTTDASRECVLLLQNVFSHYRMCSAFRTMGRHAQRRTRRGSHGGSMAQINSNQAPSKWFASLFFFFFFPIFVCVCVCICVYVCESVYMNVCVYVCMYACLHTHIHTHTRHSHTSGQRNRHQI